jgi:ferritin-like metal-binding protein YciE
MKMTSLQDLLVDELKDLYSAETLLLKALPKMARAATSPELRAAFEEHMEQTQGQKERLEQIFEGLGMKAKSKPCEGMKGIIEEGDEMMKKDAEDATMDAALIAAAQKAEHYEIASYGTCRTWAQTLGLDEAVSLLQQTLNEEEETDKRLTQLAVSGLNQMSAGGESEDEGAEEETPARGRRAFAGLHTEDEDEEADLEEDVELSGEEEEEEEVTHAYAKGSRGRTGNPATTGRGDAGSRNPKSANQPAKRSRKERSSR